MEVHAEDAQGVITISGPPPSAIKVRFVNSKPALLLPHKAPLKLPHLGLKESGAPQSGLVSLTVHSHGKMDRNCYFITGAEKVITSSTVSRCFGSS